MCFLIAAMPLYQKIVDLANNPTNNGSNGNIARGSIFCPDQLTVPGVSSYLIIC